MDQADLESTEQEAHQDGEIGLPSPETVIFYRSPLADLPHFLFLIVLSCLALLLQVRFPGSIQHIEIGSQVSIPVPLFPLVPLMYFFYVMHKLWDCRYIVGHDYVRAITGLMSLKKEDVELDLRDIRGIEIARGLYGRIANVGDLHVGSAMKDDVELVICGIYNPSKYRDLIRDRRKTALGEEHREW